jgi:predicted O-methyltransferase YrrM
MDKIKLLIKYSVYRYRRKGAKGHGLHSPFVFEFNRKVLNSREDFPEYREIMEYRNNLLGSDELIEVDDRGAGSKYFDSNLRKAGDIVRKSGSSLSMGKLLFRLARFFEPVTIIEIGTSLGFGTFCLARGAAGSKVYSIEACTGQVTTARRELDRWGVANVELTGEPFSTGLPAVLGRTGRADMVYFDGDHRKDSLLWQFNQCLEKVSPDSVFIVGDTNWSAGMSEAWELLCINPAVTVSIDLFHCGLLLFRKGIAKQHFVLGFSV